MSSDSYYDVGGITTIEIIRKKLTPEQYRGFLLGNILKYSSRINHKGNFVADSAKLNEYSLWLADDAAQLTVYYKEDEEEVKQKEEPGCPDCERCEDILWLTKDDPNFDVLSDSLQRRIERFLSEKIKKGGTYS